jgi:hypothetical protein
MQHRAEEVVAEIAAAGISEKGLRTLLGDAARGADLAALAQVHIPDRGSFLGSRRAQVRALGGVAEAISHGRGAARSDFHLEIGRIRPICTLFHTWSVEPTTT